MMSSLYAWKNTHFKSVPKEMQWRRDRLDELQQKSDLASLEEKQVLLREMDEFLYREKILWMQRSRVAWLLEGDRNTKFFHRKASWRHKKNKVRKLRRSDGTWTMDPGEMENMSREFFEGLFTREENLDPTIITNLLHECVDEEMNEKLCAPFTEKEIGDAIFQIGPLKVSGPDGFAARFMQRNWDIMHHDVTRAVHHFFEDGIMPEGVNDTAIVLIPKKNDPESLKDFRPISLCNVIYKVVSKCMVNRLRPILQDIISPIQRAFIPGRLITDNALGAFEFLHSIQ
jgi:hypothetical protein